LSIIFAVSLLAIVSTFTFSTLDGLLLALRLNFGLFLFVLFFSCIKLPSIQPVVLFLSFLTIVEFILIRADHNLVTVMPNYDGSFVVNEINGIIGGVHSFGGNRTVTGSILLSLFVFLERTQPSRRFRFLPLIASLLSGSGLAVSLIFAYLIFTNLRKLVRLSPIIAILLTLLFFRTRDQSLFPKFSSDYFSFLWDYKLYQLNQFFSGATSVITPMFGLGSSSFTTNASMNTNYGSMFGDFALLDLIARFGLLGLLFFLIIPFSITNNVSLFPFLILSVSTLHYHVLFSAPGQIVGAYILCYSMYPFLHNRLTSSSANIS